MTMKAKPEFRVIVVLDLSLQSGREHLDGFYHHADGRTNWEGRLVPSVDESSEPMVKSIIEKGIDGAVVKSDCSPSIADAIFATGVPVVAIDRPCHSMSHTADSYILNDNKLFGREAAKYFDTLGRFAAYGFVPDPNGREWSKARGSAFMAAVAQRHRDTKVSQLQGDISEWIASLPKPLAVFAAFDRCATMVFDACHELCLSIPNSVAVLGVDDDAIICEHTRPKLSSIRPNTVMQGFEAAKELDRLLLGKPRHVRPIVCPHIGISERDSTAPIPPGVRIVRETNAYLDRHALDPIRVADVVMHIGVSARLANLRYSESTGRSIQEELVNRRLSEAKRLLSKTSWPMKRIATRCGFSSATIFAHLFTAHFGMSMRNFRASARGTMA